MSRFGKLPVLLPQGVQVTLVDHSVEVKGPKGSLKRDLPRKVSIEQSDGQLVGNIKNDSKQSLALQGTTRSHLVNMISGVTEGWARELEMVGSGYRAEVKGDELILNIGYSHPVSIKAPQGVSFVVEKTKITVSGIDKEVVGQISAQIRAVRPPEPYKGKGIHYTDEVIRRKPGKQAAKTV